MSAARLISYVKSLFRRGRMEDDLSEELQFHLQNEIQRQLTAGLTPEAARYAALRSFGCVDQIKEQCRDVRDFRIVGEFCQDLRFALRMLVRKPSFAAAVILTLALGIGANTTIFSVLNPLLFKPLPYPHADRLVTLGRVTPSSAREGYPPLTDLFWSYPIFTTWKQASQSFDALAGYSNEVGTLVVAGQPERADGEMVTASYFSLLGVKAHLGRTFVSDEDLRGSLPVMVIGHRFWQRRFGGDLDVIGKEVSIDKLSFTVIGVTEPEFRGQFGRSDFWLSMAMAEKFHGAETLRSPGSSWLMTIARLKPGVSLKQARAELPIVAERVSEAVPGYRLESDNQKVDLIPLQQTKVDPVIARAFAILLAAVGCVLLIACANTTNLLLARAVERQKEFAVRLSLGAGRQRILRQVLTESILLALLGGGVGLLVALWGVHWLTTNKPWNSSGMIVSHPWTFEYFAIQLDWRVLLFNSVLALGTGVVLGCAPAWRASRAPANPMLSQGVVSGFRSGSSWNYCRGLVASAVALSLVLLTGAGLLTKSLMQLLRVNPGFDPEHVVTVSLGESDQPNFLPLLLERVQALAGVELACLSSSLPFNFQSSSDDLEIEGEGPKKRVEVRGGVNIVTPDYFRALRIRLLRGRSLTSSDQIGSPRTMVINRTMAEGFWPGQDPLGKRIKVPSLSDEWIETVGVVDDVRYGPAEAPVEAGYNLSAGDARPNMTSPRSLAIRTTGDSASILRAVQREAHLLDKGVAVSLFGSMTEIVRRSTQRFRDAAFLMGLFAFLAVVMAAIGIYGMMAYAVSARTREVGIRLAIGAQRMDIFKLVLCEGLLLILAGVAIGLGGALASARVLRNQLYQVAPSDPPTFLAVTLLLVLVALLACYIPARRATRVDPAVALRYE